MARPVPAFPGWWAALGPGIVWLALAQGSGELIWWPYVIAKYGLTFLWLLIPACLLQYPLTYEIGRYTLLTGESIWTGFLRLNRWCAAGLWGLMVVQFCWFGAFASAGGTALAALTQWPPGWSARGQSLLWGYLSIAVCLAGLVFSRVIYRTIERVMWVVAGLTVCGLAAAATHPAVLSVAPEFLRGLAGPVAAFPRPWDRADASVLLTAITFAGLGGFWTLFYSYWLHEKGAGMAAHAKPLAGLRGLSQPASAEGAWLPEATREAAQGLRRWLRFLAVDVGIGISGNVVTTLLMCLLAYAVLFPQGIYPKAWELAVVQAQFFALRWGQGGRLLFLLVAAAFLADTWMSTVDAVSRVNTDVVRRLWPQAGRRPARWWYFAFLWLFTGITCATMPLAQPGSLIVLSAVIGFAGTVLFTGAIWWLNFRWLARQLPASAQPGSWARAGLTVSWLAYLVLAATYLLSV